MLDTGFLYGRYYKYNAKTAYIVSECIGINYWLFDEDKNIFLVLLEVYRIQIIHLKL